jgi:ankyrin repeat protein
MLGMLSSQSMLTAARDGDVHRVRYLVEGTRFAQWCSFFQTVCVVCSGDRLDSEFQGLPKYGVGARSQDNMQYYAVEGATCQVTEANIYGMTPLHYAARNGHLGVVKYLMSKGASLEYNRDPLLLLICFVLCPRNR